MGGIAFYINDQLPNIKIENPSDIEILTIEITICKNKILAAGMYKPLNLSETDFTTSLETVISKLLNKYEKLILLGDFNMTKIRSVLSQFLDTHCVKSVQILSFLRSVFSRIWTEYWKIRTRKNSFCIFLFKYRSSLF